MTEIATPLRKRRGILSLQNALWLVAVIAVWYSWYLKAQDVKRLNARIAMLQGLARELVVADPNQFAVVQREPQWYDDAEWEIHVPEGNFELCVATRDLEKTMTPIKAAQSAPIVSGRRVVVLTQNDTPTGSRVSVVCDGKDVLTVDEPKEWCTRSGSEGSGMFSTSAQAPKDRPLVLFHRQFIGAYVPNAPRPDRLNRGIHLWIRSTKL